MWIVEQCCERGQEQVDSRGGGWEERGEVRASEEERVSGVSE